MLANGRNRRAPETQFIRANTAGDPTLLPRHLYPGRMASTWRLFIHRAARLGAAEPANYLHSGSARAGRRGWLMDAAGRHHSVTRHRSPTTSTSSPERKAMLRGRVAHRAAYLRCCRHPAAQAASPFTLDRWVQSGYRCPGPASQLKPALDAVDEGRQRGLPDTFPYTWPAVVGQAIRASCLERFLQLFPEQRLTPPTRSCSASSLPGRKRR